MMTETEEMLAWLNARADDSVVKAEFVYQVSWYHKYNFFTLLDLMRLQGLEVTDEGHSSRYGGHQGTLTIVGPVRYIKDFVISSAKYFHTNKRKKYND